MVNNFKMEFVEKCNICLKNKKFTLEFMYPDLCYHRNISDVLPAFTKYFKNETFICPRCIPDDGNKLNYDFINLVQLFSKQFGDVITDETAVRGYLFRKFRKALSSQMVGSKHYIRLQFDLLIIIFQEFIIFN